MITLRLRNKLILGALAISIVMACAFMLAVSWVISQQYLDQSSAILSKASRMINDNLEDRKTSLLNASRQLAAEQNLGSTIWYLGQYEQSDVDRKTLSSTYQQLVRDTYKIGRIAEMSRIAIYDADGKLVSFALFGSHAERVGFVVRYPSPVFRVATQKEGDELDWKKLQAMHDLAGLEREFAGNLPTRESVQFAVVNSKLAIASYVPIVGEVFNPVNGKKESKSRGLIVGVRLLDQDFVDYLSRLTDIKMNVFTQAGYVSGDLPEYRMPDWNGTHAHGLISRFNEVRIGDASYYQSLIPLYSGQQQVGSIAALQSRAKTQKNIHELIATLGLIAAGSLLLIFPFV